MFLSQKKSYYAHIIMIKQFETSNIILYLQMI